MKAGKQTGTPELRLVPPVDHIAESFSDPEYYEFEKAELEVLKGALMERLFDSEPTGTSQEPDRPRVAHLSEDMLTQVQIGLDELEAAHETGALTAEGLSRIAEVLPARHDDSQSQLVATACQLVEAKLVEHIVAENHDSGVV